MYRWLTKSLVLSILFTCNSFAQTTSIAPAKADNISKPLISWVELGANASTIARSVTADNKCPDITIDQQTRTMRLRVAREPDFFSVNVCEAHIPFGSKTARIGEQTLVLPKQNPQKILVIGDTGCRLKFNEIQGCNDPKQWPFGQSMRQAANWQPDLVIHVGDYLYRERSCPDNVKECQGTPYMDTWSTWQTDFFQPAKPLLTTAPWIFIRGNHESCLRAGNGWFKLLDPAAYLPNCRDYTSPYIIPIGDTTLFIIDSSKAEDVLAPSDQVALFRQYFELIERINSPNIWLLTHKPIWSTAVIDKVGSYLEKVALSTLQVASQDHIPPNLRFILSGHIHLFEVINFTEPHPTQIIAGNGGTQLESPHLPPFLGGQKIANLQVNHGLALSRFGFFTLEKTPWGWLGTEYSPTGEVMAKCQQLQHKFICHSKYINEH